MHFWKEHCNFKQSDLLPLMLRYRQKHAWTQYCGPMGNISKCLFCHALPQRGKPRFVVLFTDMLLVLKVKKPHGSGKLGAVFTSSPSKLEWFADREYSAREVSEYTASLRRSGLSFRSPHVICCSSK